MDLGAQIALILGLFWLAFMLNVPMGYLRGKTRKYSVSWFLCIHASIPVIAMGRMFSGVNAWYIPVFIAAAVLGQVSGGRLDF